MTMIRMLAFRPGGTGDHAGEVSLGGPARAGTAPGSVSRPAGAGKPDLNAAGDWQQMMNEMGLTGMVKEFAGHCVLKERGNNRIHLAINPAQEHLLKSAQKDRLQAAVHDYYGTDVKLVITAEHTGLETPVQLRDREDQERKRMAEESFQQDPFVKDMLDTFNASVEHKSIQPK
jgi:DNA polymerase-3 subunit gamma/tau